MIINRSSLFDAAPIKNMVPIKTQQDHGVSYGMSEAGYDIRIKQEVHFKARNTGPLVYVDGEPKYGRFVLASAMEEFQMPRRLVGIVHDKSTWARQGLSVFNTVIEPGWNGFLTLELVFNGNGDVLIPSGSGIAQVIFHQTEEAAQYTGKYQHQADSPVPAKFSGIAEQLEQAALAGNYGDIDYPAPNHFDPSKRGFIPK